MFFTGVWWAKPWAVKGSLDNVLIHRVWIGVVLCGAGSWTWWCRSLLSGDILWFYTLLLLSVTLCGMEYHFGPYGSAVLAVEGALFQGGFGGSWRECWSSPMQFSNSQNAAVVILAPVNSAVGISSWGAHAAAQSEQQKDLHARTLSDLTGRAW